MYLIIFQHFHLEQSDPTPNRFTFVMFGSYKQTATELQLYYYKATISTSNEEGEEDEGIGTCGLFLARKNHGLRFTTLTIISRGHISEDNLD